MRRSVKRLSIGIAFLLLVLLMGEWFCRAELGLGDPPLSRADPQIEYLFVGPRVYHRFGHIIEYNEFSQRTHAIAGRRIDPAEIRVVVCGDSVINGGNQTDQSELATSLLEKRLVSDFHRPAAVMNVSAASWGPPNYDAYIHRYGLFEANALVIVVSSHDFADSPTFAPVVGTADYPDVTPTFALEEAITRYLPRYLPHFGRTAGTASPAAPPAGVANVTQGQIDQAMGAFRDLVKTAQASHIPVIVAQHLEQAEYGKSEWEGHAAFRKACDELHVTRIELSEIFGTAMKAGKQPYRDNIHPNPLGQSLMADAIYPSLQAAIAATGSAPATQGGR